MTATPELVRVSRRLPVGAELQGGAGAHFRVWAADHESVTLVLEREPGQVVKEWALTPEGDGYFSALVPSVAAGTLYRYRFDDSPSSFPDPASRAQPFGPHGPSQIVDPSEFAWSDHLWQGRR